MIVALVFVGGTVAAALVSFGLGLVGIGTGTLPILWALGFGMLCAGFGAMIQWAIDHLEPTDTND